MARSFDWKKEHARLWDRLVPRRGQADTLQGELIRIAGNLTDEAYRNGNLNWDADCERMWRFVGATIGHDPRFSPQEQQGIRDAIDEIIRDYDNPDTSGDGSCYYLVGERVVDWCMAHPTPIRYKSDDKLGR